MALRQRDFLIEADDELVIRGDSVLREIVQALPAETILKPYQIREVLSVSEDVIYHWIESGKFAFINLTSGKKGVPRYGIFRASFIKFLSTRVNKAF